MISLVVPRKTTTKSPTDGVPPRATVMEVAVVAVLPWENLIVDIHQTLHVVDARSRANLVKSSLAVDRQPCHAIPADWTSTHQLVNDRADYHVELFGTSLSKCLLPCEQGIEDTSTG